MTRPLTDPKVFNPPHDESGMEEPTCYFLSASPTTGVFTFTREQDAVVRLDGVPVPQRYVYHSPTGFEWGYGGSGPSDLALNVLALFVPPPEAWRLHHEFKRDFIASLPHDGGQLEVADIRAWIDAQWAERPVDEPAAADGSHL